MYTRVHALKAPIWSKITTKMLFFMLATIFVLMMALYVYLVHKTIMNVVAESNDQKVISTLSSASGEMEFKYITLKDAVTIDLAYSKGFKDTSPTQYIAGAQTLTYNY
jgi:hypothetical protein